MQATFGIKMKCGDLFINCSLFNVPQSNHCKLGKLALCGEVVVVEKEEHSDLTISVLF